MTFDFKKYIPTQFKFPKKPNDSYEYMNVNQVRWKELLKQHKEDPAKVTKERLEKFRAKWMETEEDRFKRWEQQFHQKHLEERLLRDYSTFKDNPKDYLRKAMDLGSRGIGQFTKWWWTKPKKSVGIGRLVQSPITGKWSQQYKPHKSRKIRDWLKAAERGDVFRGSLNPNGIPIKLNEPTEEMKYIHGEATRKREMIKWRWFLKETNFMGSKDDKKRKMMWDDPIVGFWKTMDIQH